MAKALAKLSVAEPTTADAPLRSRNSHNHFSIYLNIKQLAQMFTKLNLCIHLTAR